MRVFQNIQKRKLLYFLVLIVIATYFIFNAIRDESTFSYLGENSILLGLSIVEDDPSAIPGILYNSSDADGTQFNNITSFLLQSSNPVAQIFLDYIYIPNNSTPVDRICFQEIITTSSDRIPTQLFSESNAMASLKIEENSYTYEFKDNRCAYKGENHTVPHILLGIVPVNSHAMFGLIKGFRASHFFPLDEQKIELNIAVKIDEFERFSPSLQVVVAQKGWVGTISYGDSNKPILHLLRPGVYKGIFGAFFLIMVFIIPFLNNVVGESGSFFEITFGLLLGLWGMHEILVPSYIDSSILIDVAIYTLYILVMVVILGVLIFEIQKRKVQILDIDRQNYDSEHVTIENQSYFSIDLTGWLLLNKAGNKYIFPKFTITGRKLLRGEKHNVKIWTKAGMDTNTDLYWGKLNPIWDGNQATAYLEDTKNEIMSAHNNPQ